MLQLVGGNAELRENLFVPFKNLDGIPPLPFRRHVVQHGLFDVGDGMFDRPRKCMHRKRMRLFRRLDGLLRGRHDAVVVQGGNFHDLATELVRKLLKINSIAILADNVHHVHGDDHRDAQFGQLRRQIEVALQIRAVNDVQNSLRLFVQKIFTRNDFL